MTAAYDRNLAAWFEGRRWRVMDELSGVSQDNGIQITYCRGAFEIDQPGVFETPFKYRGRRGIVIREIDGQGADLAAQAAFGESTLRRAQASYGTVSGLPEEESDVPDDTRGHDVARRAG